MSKRSRSTSRSRLAGALAVAAACLVASSSVADRVQLRQSVQLGREAMEVRLKDIAMLEGHDALRLGSLIVARRSDPNGIMEIDVHDVHERLDTAGVHWGRVHLSGSKVIVRPHRIARLAPPVAMTPMTVSDMTPPERPADAGPKPVVAATLIDQPTLRGVIADTLARHFAVAPSHLRLTFHPTDDPILDLSRRTLQFDVAHQRSARTETVTLTVDVYDDKRRVDTHQLTVVPHVLIDTSVLTRTVQRGEMISQEHVTAVAEWLSPLRAEQFPAPSDVLGRLADGRLREGDVLRREHLHQPVLVHRGDTVTVRCVSGDIVISSPAVAREDGVAGDVIRFRLPRHRETFLARVTGRGEAVVDMQTTMMDADMIHTARKDDR